MVGGDEKKKGSKREQQESEPWITLAGRVFQGAGRVEERGHPRRVLKITAALARCTNPSPSKGHGRQVDTTWTVRHLALFVGRVREGRGVVEVEVRR